MHCKIPDIFILSFKKVFGSKIFVTQIFSILSVQFSDIKNIHIAVHPSLISISRSFSSSQSEMLCELSNSSPLFPPLQPLATTTVLSVSMKSNPWVRRSPGGRHGNPPQYSSLENPMGKGAWRATVHRVTKSRTQLKQLSTCCR